MTVGYCRTVGKSVIKSRTPQLYTSTKHWGSMNCFVIASGFLKTIYIYFV